MLWGSARVLTGFVFPHLSFVHCCPTWPRRSAQSRHCSHLDNTTASYSAKHLLAKQDNRRDIERSQLRELKHHTLPPECYLKAPVLGRIGYIFDIAGNYTNTSSVPRVLMSRSQCLLLRRHVRNRDTEIRRLSARAGSATDIARVRSGTSSNAARERSRVRTLRSAFLKLQLSLPSVPPDTKLSKLDVLLLATDYIQHLTRRLDSTAQTTGQSTGQTTGYNLGQTKVQLTGHSLGQNTGQTKECSTVQTSTCEETRGSRTRVQSPGMGRQAGSDDRTPSRDETSEQRRADSKPRQGRHPVKKWPMRSRLYDCILLDGPPSRTSGDNSLKNTSSKDI